MSKDKFTKHDNNKPMISLVESEFIIGVAQVLTFGAKKYSSYDIILPKFNIKEVTWRINKEYVSAVTCLTRKSNQESVVLATTNGDSKINQSVNIAQIIKKYSSNLLWNAEIAMRQETGLTTQNLSNDSIKIDNNGTKKTKKKLKQQKKSVIKTLEEGKMLRKVDGQISSVGTTLPKKIMTVYVHKGVNFAKEQTASGIWTMIMKQVNSEGYFVVGATTDSECWEIIYTVLNALSLTLNEPQRLVKSGIDNWKNMEEKDLRRIKDSLLRHTLAYTSGELLDPETGLSHAYHASCNLMFLNYFDNLKKKK